MYVKIESMTTIPVIAVEGLTKNFRRFPAVEDISFSVEKGEVIGFVGLNGAGKSTTINMLLGFARPSKGTISLFGKQITTANAHKSHQNVGYATGDMHLFDEMTGRQYLRFVAKSYHLPLNSKRVAELVARFQPQLDKKIKTLSRGNHQKIALIAAFMVGPELIILDEPSSGLDPLMQQRFLELVRQTAAEGTTIFMSSHYLAEVADVCSRILLIKDGKLVKDISSAELEAAAGKLVQVETNEPVRPPVASEIISQQRGTLKFVYRGKAEWLQRWVSSLTGLKDITITDHSAEAAFRELYGPEEESKDA
jgi:ABC-2 type transport system ATP-binding protein